MKHFTLLLLLSLHLFSCSSKKEEGKESTDTSVSKNVSFDKLDSIKIDYLGSPTVHDLNPESEIVLFMENKQFSENGETKHASEEIFLADFEGNIITSFSKLGDMPDNYGSLMSTLRILDDKTFIAYGYNGFLTYNFSGKLQSRVKLRNFKVPYFSRKVMGYGMEKSGNRFLYTNQELPVSVSHSDIRFYEVIDLMTWLNPESGDIEPFMKFPENSLFRSGKHFYGGAWEPIFTIEDDRIYIVFGCEPVIYVYSLTKPYVLLSSIPFILEDYRYFRGSITNSFDFGLIFTSGRVSNIKKVDGHFVIAYFPGYSSADKAAEGENKSREENLIFRERMLKKYAERIAILDSAGNRLSDFIPEGLVASSMLVRNGELWMLEKPDEEIERDYFRLFRVGLKFD